MNQYKTFAAASRLINPELNQIQYFQYIKILTEFNFKDNLADNVSDPADPRLHHPSNSDLICA